jgi:hypothetical protein
MFLFRSCSRQDFVGSYALDKLRVNSSRQDDAFEWDDAKAASNFLKHKVSFELARGVFADAFAIEREDTTEDYGEPRYNLLGLANSRLLFVAYTTRGEIVRIISAREAEPYERRLYHEENARKDATHQA